MQNIIHYQYYMGNTTSSLISLEIHRGIQYFQDMSKDISKNDEMWHKKHEAFFSIISNKRNLLHKDKQQHQDL